MHTSLIPRPKPLDLGMRLDACRLIVSYLSYIPLGGLTAASSPGERNRVVALEIGLLEANKKLSITYFGRSTPFEALCH